MNYIPSLINETYEIVLPEFRHTFFAERPNWERGRLAHMFDTVQKGWTIYDLGAEHADFSALYSLWTGVPAIPVEPCDHYWPFVLGTYEANDIHTPSVCFHGFAADSDRNFSRGLTRDMWPVASLGVGIPDGGFLHLAHEQRKPRITIDTLATYNPPNAVVLDIEGAELRALQGATRTLELSRPVVWVSMHPVPMLEWYNCTPDDVFRLFEEVEYDMERLPDYGEIEDFYAFTPR